MPNSPSPRKQHVVSQVLLRRFVNAEDELGVFDLVQAKQRVSTPAAVGFVKDFIKSDASTSEAKWGEVEGRMPAALAAVDDQSLFESSGSIATLKDCMALHWARSKTVQEIVQRLRGNVVARRKQAMFQLDPEVLDDIFRDRFGLEPVGPEARKPRGRGRVRES